MMALRREFWPYWCRKMWHERFPVTSAGLAIELSMKSINLGMNVN